MEKCGWWESKPSEKVAILGTESLGVRGLSCTVQVGDRSVVIDPGVALGYRRHGPPLYLAGLSPEQRQRAWENGLRLARGVNTLILDHHLLRSEAGLRWLDRLASVTGRRVLCAADFMDHPRHLLEAWRRQLYAEMPVPEGWHEAYANNQADTGSFGFLKPRIYSSAA